MGEQGYNIEMCLKPFRRDKIIEVIEGMGITTYALQEIGVRGRSIVVYRGAEYPTRTRAGTRIIACVESEEMRDALLAKLKAEGIPDKNEQEWCVYYPVTFIPSNTERAETILEKRHY